MDAEHRRIIENQRCHLAKKIILNEELISYFREYKMFNKYMWNDIKSMSDLLNLLPYRGPDAFRNLIEILRKTGYNAEAELLENPSSSGDVAQDLYYKMSSTPLGYCLIINNVEFGNMLEYRHGSDVDAESLKSFFEGIGFVVEPKRNKSTEDMLECIKIFSRKDFSSVDAMVLIILSHGSQVNDSDIIYGCDEQYIHKKEIYRLFDNRNVRGLQDKPKIFFFIACRGSRHDHGVPRESIDSNITVSVLSDAFIVHSTLPEQVSIRDHENGSYFCETLISVLKKYHKVHDLDTIINLVNRELRKKISREFRIIQNCHCEKMGAQKKAMLCRTV